MQISESRGFSSKENIATTVIELTNRKESTTDIKIGRLFNGQYFD